MAQDDTKVHLLCDGFMKGYMYWISRGEGSSSNSLTTTNQNSDGYNIEDNTHIMLNEAFGVHGSNISQDGNTTVDKDDQPNIEAEAFYRLLRDAQQEAYPGCTKFSVLSFLVLLLHIKCKNRWSDKSVTELLQFLKEVLPQVEKLPKTYYEAKKVVGDLGLSYRKIHACPNDCTLYWKEHEQDNECHICKSSRYVRVENNLDEEANSSKKHKVIHVKVLWHSL